MGPYIAIVFMKRALTLLGFVLLASLTFGQDASEDEMNFRSSFVEGNQLMAEFNYSVALDVWLGMIKDFPDKANANVNFKTGVCLWKLPKRKQDALPYFQEAIKNVNERYDPFSPAEEGAPIETFYYIGNAYHLNYELDSAIVYYNKFKNHINHNHEFWARTDLEIAMCNTAKEAIRNPVDIEVINLGSLVNSQYPDYAPVISVDESAVYFTSKRLRPDSSNLYARNPEDGEFYEDIYVSYKGDDGAWNEPEQLNFNTSNNEATLSLSADGETMYIYRTGEKGYGDLYYSKLDGLNWTAPQKLGSDINTEFHETHASVSPDGSRLYFVSDREGSMKFPDKAHDKVESRDIYFCNMLPTGDWALAQPLTDLNTPYHEDGVFIHPDGKTMFFSSEGHGSMGGFDIFVSEWNEEDSAWGKPENIGYPLNTTDDDIFFVTSASGKRAYYSSIRDNGYGDKDIYVISMLSFKEIPLTLLIGEIASADGSEVPEDIFIYVTDNETGEEIGTFKPRARDHKFTIIIPPGSDYHLDYVYEDSTFYQDDIFVPYNSAYQEINKGISMGGIAFGGMKKANEQEEADLPISGAKEPSVEGKLLYSGAGAAGVLLNLKDTQGNKVGSTTTDGSGNFVFRSLEPGSLYYVAIDPSNGTVPDDAQLFMKDPDSKAMMPVAKTGKGTFAFQTLPYMSEEELEMMAAQDDTPAPAKGGVKNPTVDGTLKYGSAAAAGVLLNLENDKNEKVGTAITDKNGEFQFRNLEDGSKYYVMIDPANGEVPSDAQLYIKDDKTGKMLPVSKLADGSFAFETLPYMEAEELAQVETKDDETKVEKKEPVKEEKKQPEKKMPPAYKTEVREVDGEKYIIHEVQEGETMFDISLIYNLKFPVVEQANPDKGDLIYPGDQIMLPIPPEVMFFQEFFDYGQSTINTGSTDYKNFLGRVEEVVKDNGKALLMIESSSSKVPSTKGNDNLSKLRADNAKEALKKSMSERGVGADKLNFVDESTLVRGPEFNNDTQENRATYKNFQYVKIIVK